MSELGKSVTVNKDKPVYTMVSVDADNGTLRYQYMYKIYMHCITNIKNYEEYNKYIIGVFGGAFRLFINE